MIAILYGAACAIAQDDLKRMLAYSSFSHLGFCLLGIFALNETGLTGSYLQMINHGLNVGALFFICEILSHRYGTTKFKDLQGLGSKLKILSGISVFYVMCSVGLPGLNGFVGEVMCLFGMFESKNPNITGKVIASICSLGMVFGAWYLISMVMKVFFGKLSEPVFKKEDSVSDLTLMEKFFLFPMAILCLILGMYPQPMIDTIRPEIHLIAKLNLQANNLLPVGKLDK
jgi:NADH-quinone oxidoreductase subunit M